MVGGVIRGNINSVLREALATYKYYNEDPERFMEVYLRDMPLRKKEIETANENFVAKIKDIKLDFLDGISQSEIRYSEIVFIDEPKYELGYVGNAGPFAVGIKDKNGVPVRTQYMGKDGVILENPIVTYYIDGEWVDTNPLAKTKITPESIERATEKSVTLSDMSNATQEIGEALNKTNPTKEIID